MVSHFEELAWDVWRSAIWLRSRWLEWSQMQRLPYEREALRRIWLICELAEGFHRIVSDGKRINVSAASTLARPTFETGLMCSWLLVGAKDPNPQLQVEQIYVRHLALCRNDTNWVVKIANTTAASGLGGERWLQGTEEMQDHYAQLESFYFPDSAADDLRLPPIPSVRGLLADRGQLRLYYGYMISSQWIHGTGMGAREFDPFRRQAATPIDLMLATSQTIWGVLLAARAYVQRPSGEGWLHSTARHLAMYKPGLKQCGSRCRRAPPVRPCDGGERRLRNAR